MQIYIKIYLYPTFDGTLKSFLLSYNDHLGKPKKGHKSKKIVCFMRLLEFPL